MEESTSVDPAPELQSGADDPTSSLDILQQVIFRQVIPTDITDCFAIEKVSYPKDEAGSKSDFQYRQHFAEKYFRCCVLGDDDEEEIVGYINATRCRVFTEEAMATHDATGPLLAIHSVVVAEKYRRRGIATAMMKNYIDSMSRRHDGVERFVMIVKENLLGFYVKCGYQVLRPSDIVHGKELWYHLELPKETGTPIWVVDSFIDTPGKGNPAGVVLLQAEPSRIRLDVDPVRQEWCRTVAREFNHSETAFCWKMEDDEKSIKYGIRYYTCNGTEVDLCGHATLAAAAVLFQQFRYPSITFYAKYDELIMTPAKYWTGKKMQVSMNFPLKTVTDVSRSTIVDMLRRAFPKLKERIKDSILYSGIDQDGNDLLVEVKPELLNDIGYDDIVHSALDWDGYKRGVILCSIADDSDDIDFVSRFFGPKFGIPEDPVTGSAHCTLAPYFGKKLNQTELKAEQRSKRGGKILCTIVENRVTLMGSAVITVTGNSWI